MVKPNSSEKSHMVCAWDLVSMTPLRTDVDMISPRPLQKDTRERSPLVTDDGLLSIVACWIKMARSRTQIFVDRSCIVNQSLHKPLASACETQLLERFMIIA
uniref:Uncharacterized protein n=1 Tax=Photinus pyralis TaxID=7054 RepID=A0A1Y1JRN5_PHOPY